MVKARQKIHGKFRSQHIREYLQGHPNPEDRTTQVVVDAMAEQGVKIKPALVTYAKISMRSRRRTRRVMDLRDAVKTLSLAKKFVQEVGGIEKAKIALDAFAEI
jgi:hypothetical protein